MANVFAFKVLFICSFLMPTLCKDISMDVFGKNSSHYLPAAFGDFNADKLTDIFVIEKLSNGSYIVKVLLSHNISPILRLSEPQCKFDMHVKGVVPSDFDGDGAMDILVISFQEGLYECYILWGDLKRLACLEEYVSVASLKTQPSLVDYNGDMISDLFGEGADGNRSFWVFNNDRKKPLRVPMELSEMNADPLPPLKKSGGHAFVDIDKDLAADLWVSAKGRFEFWPSSNDFQFYEVVEHPKVKGKDVLVIGQSTFCDIDLDGNIEVMLPICLDAGCDQSFIYVYEFMNVTSKWYDLKINLKDKNEVTWSFPSDKASYLYTNTITPRVGDINLDGYPDILITVFNGNTPKVILLINCECKTDCEYPRTFIPQWDTFDAWQNSVLGTFFDFFEDGILDVLVVNASSDGKTYTMGAYKETAEYDAMFVKELHISPYGDQVGLLFDRVYVPPPDTPNPNILAGSALQNLVRPLDSSEAQKIMLDATLTAVHRASIELPNRRSHPQGTAAGPGGDANHVGFSKAVWSYRGAMEGDGCFLCLVTYDHQIHLVGQIGIKWKVVYSLTSLWHKYSTNEGKVILEQYQSLIGPKQHHKFIAETRFQGVADLAWTEKIKNSSHETFSVLLMVTTSSHLALLKIPMFRKDNFEPSVLGCFALDDSIGKVSALHWFTLNEREGFLSVGTVKGFVEIYFLSLKENNIFNNRLFKFDNSIRGMSVNHLRVTCVNANKRIYILFVGKHNILIAYLLFINASNVKILASTHSLFGCFAISGLRVVDSTLLYTSVKDGKLVKVEVDYDLTSNSICFRSKEAIFTSDGVLYNGFCFSPNNSFLAILECVSVPYDHLLMREPTMVSLFQVNTFNTIIQHLMNNESQTLCEQVDVFESLRLSTYREGDITFPTITTKDIASLSLHLKRVYLWTIIIELGSLSRNDRPQDKNMKEELRNALEESILIDYVSEVLSSCSKESFPSDSVHRHSLHLMCTFLQQIKHNHPLMKRIKSHLKKESVKGEEKCLVCKSSVEFTSIKIAKCSQGHSMPRCFRSLVPTLPVMRCIHCHLFYHPQASLWYGEVATTCLICLRKLLPRVRRGSTLLSSSISPV